MIAYCGLLLAMAAMPQGPAIATIQLPEGIEVTGQMLLDLDGDQREDLVLACRNDDTGQRSLRVHLRQPTSPSFKQQPSRLPQLIDRDVVAFTFCDCLPAAGPELILLTPEQVVAAITNDDGSPGYRRLTRHTLVWPAADDDAVAPLPQSAVDFDADGLVDLLLPSPNGWTVLLQDRDGAEPTFERRVQRLLPERRSAMAAAMQNSGLGGGDRALQLRFGGPGAQGGRGGTLVQTATRTPRSQLVDLDGDGRLDLAMHRNGQLFAAIQTAVGRVTVREQVLPLPENRLTLADPAFDVQLADVDGDGRADLVLTTSARRDDDVEARVDLFRTRADGSWPEKPDARLRMQALAGPPVLVDVDGDGRRDLACLSLRTSSMRDFTGGAATALDAQLSLFRNDGSQFVKPALLTRPLPLATGETRLAPPFLRVRAGSNGRPGDVLLHIDGGIERRALEPRGERLRLGPAATRAVVPDKARIVRLGGDAEELLILTDSEVQHVRFTR